VCCQRVFAFSSNPAGSALTQSDIIMTSTLAYDLVLYFDFDGNYTLDSEYTQRLLVQKRSKSALGASIRTTNKYTTPD
jgi:hypothetical protein